MPEKHCPHCHQLPLTITEYQNQEIDLCQQCGGLWFETGELEASYEHHGMEHDLMAEIGPFCHTTNHACPDCHKPLDRHQFVEQVDAHIDICHSCHGAWVDKDQIELIQHTPRIKQAMQAFNQSTSIASYLFQFLTRLPVEYNIQPRQPAYLTYGLISFNCLVFFVVAYSDVIPSQWIDWLVFSPEHFLQRPWTIVSYQFLHADLLHLLGNMYFLYIIGDNLEDTLGKAKYLALYLLFGCAAGLSFYFAHLGEAIPMVGASGAIAGFFGAYILLFKKAKLTFMFLVYQARLPAWVYFLIWFAMNCYGLFHQDTSVAWTAHIGGFIAGLLVTTLLYKRVMKLNPSIEYINNHQI
ncbi:rhomboid family intramembrane serine protease [Motilimonas pumila]|uniref:Rhomboid family intramembrane serine protease n=1 Tax=Motilimonas pumila TaxID=2303987 RepID=A0A418YHU3_9GAMM|nr:rhomboid family intramembrane serine protease [Motilimonas pumila]RJG49960.1 rhomboid family intramembrane serine protease [Motilimonas pumila]